MKVAAHPLVVAAALGLLGPEALEGFSDPEDRDRASAAPRAPASSHKGEDSFGLGLIDETLFTVDAPSPEDVARVADAWKKLG